MKRIIFFYLILALSLPLVQAAEYLPPLTPDAKNVTFVSQYSSRVMDQNTLDYFLQIRNNYGVHIIKDTWVADNNNDWKTASKNSDLIFVVALSNDVFTTSKTNFCTNLGEMLNKTKGVVFAGNASIVTPSINGCIYSAPFSLATLKRNNLLRNNSITITTSHEITSGYNLATYSLGVNDNIYAINSPTNQITLATAYGDPDGGGSQTKRSYPALTIWEGLTYRVVGWSIKTSQLSGCASCVEWDLFDNALNWASNTSAMGFVITTDKEIYAQGETIQINVKAGVSFSRPTGFIEYPDGREVELQITGGGNSWDANYPLFDIDPNGIYTINVSSTNFEAQKSVKVLPFDIAINVFNQTKQTRIEVNATKDGTIINDVNITINITTPSGRLETFSYTNNGNVVLTYNITGYGKYSVGANATDSRRRTVSAATDFYFYPTHIELNPKKILENVTKSTILTESVNITNNASVTITGIKAISGGNISDWITLDSETLADMQPDTSTILVFHINVPAIADGIRSGNITFSYDQGEVVFLISVNMQSVKTLALNVTKIERNVSENISFTEVISVSNNLDTSLTNIKIEKSGNVSDWIKLDKTSISTLKPSDSTELEVDFDILDADEGNYNGAIRFTFDQGSNEIPVTVRVKLVGVLSVEPSSAIFWTNTTAVKTAEFNLNNTGRGSLVVKSVEITDDIKNFSRIIIQPSKIDPNMSKILKIQLDPRGVALTDVSRLLRGNVTITDDQGTQKTLTIFWGVMRNPSAKIETLSDDINDAETEITEIAEKTDVTSLTEEVARMRSDLSRVATLYNAGNYEVAVNLIKDVEGRLNVVNAEIEREKANIQLRAQATRETFVKTVVIVFASLIVGIAVWFVYNRYWKVRGYRWLYKKWGRR